MAEPNPLLNQLKDIHLPPAPGVWPLAPGWYGLIAMVILALISVAWFSWRRQRANRYRKTALAELAQLESAIGQPDNVAPVVEQVAILLKRTALAAYPAHLVAGLTGEAWLAFLDKTGETTEFSAGAGRVLLSAPYQASPDGEIRALILLSREWIATHKTLRTL